MGKRVLGTVKRGTVEITSRKQMAFLHAQEIDHTHVDAQGRKKRHTY